MQTNVLISFFYFYKGVDKDEYVPFPDAERKII